MGYSDLVKMLYTIQEESNVKFDMTLNSKNKKIEIKF